MPLHVHGSSPRPSSLHATLYESLRRQGSRPAKPRPLDSTQPGLVPARFEISGHVYQSGNQGSCACSPPARLGARFQGEHLIHISSISKSWLNRLCAGQRRYLWRVPGQGQVPLRRNVARDQVREPGLPGLRHPGSAGEQRHPQLPCVRLAEQHARREKRSTCSLIG